jgi:hypothetical protein
MKRKGEMTIGTIIAIALGVALLVFLIYGFSTQWNAFQGILDPLTGGASNVDNEARGCEVACASNKVNAYCKQNRTLRFGGKEDDPGYQKPESGTCKDLESYLGITCSICP